MVELLALLLLMSLWSLVYFLVIGNRWNSSSCSSVLGVLGCSWWTYHCCCRWMNKWLGFEHCKGYIWCCSALPGRQQGLVLFGDSPRLVCCEACTLASELPVCLLLGTWSSEWISSADHGHILSFSFFLLTCQVALPLGLILVWSLCVCAGIMWWSRWRSRSSWARITWWSTM